MWTTLAIVCLILLIAIISERAWLILFSAFTIFISLLMFGVIWIMRGVIYLMTALQRGR